MYPNRDPGLVESFIVLDELAKELGTTTWHYKIDTWNE